MATTKALAHAFWKYPELGKDLLSRADCYNRSLKKLEQLEKEKKVIVIRPDNTDGFSRLEKDKEKIKALYHDGYTKGLLFSDKVKEFYTK